MIKAIICDTDGMLVHSEPFSVEVERKYGISLQLTREFYLGPFQVCLSGKSDLKEIIAPYLASWGWKKSVDEYLAEWFTFEHKLDEELITYLTELRKSGLKLYLITNQEKYRTEYLLDKMEFSGIFDEVFSSAHTGSRKPEQAMFAAAYTHIDNFKKDEVVFWDDQQKNVDAAKNFGFHAELYTSLSDFKQKIKAYTEHEQSFDGKALK